MSATTRFAAAIVTLSVLLSPVVTATPLEYPSCKPKIVTVYATVTAAPGLDLSTPVKAVLSKTSTSPAPGLGSSTPVDAILGKTSTSPTPGLGSSTPVNAVLSKTFSTSPISIPASFPSYSPQNPNPNGPFYNPNDYVPLPFTWPGKPTGSESLPPPRPTPVWNYGGNQAHLYNAPAWVPKGSDLTPALSQSETNGDSIWGTLQCPRLPPYLGPEGGNGTAKVSLSSASKNPFKTSSSSFGTPIKPVRTSSSSFGTPLKPFRTTTLSFGLSGRPTDSSSLSRSGVSGSPNAASRSSVSGSSGFPNAAGSSSRSGSFPGSSGFPNAVVSSSSGSPGSFNASRSSSFSSSFFPGSSGFPNAAVSSSSGSPGFFNGTVSSSFSSSFFPGSSGFPNAAVSTSSGSSGFFNGTVSSSFSSSFFPGSSGFPNAAVSSSSGSSGFFNATGTVSSFSFQPTGFSSSVSGTGASAAFPTLSSSAGPFSNGTTINSTLSACGPIPDTGVTRTYNFDVSLQQIAPDGVQKNGLVVNGGFPGPLIEANWGDWIEVTVTNSLPDEGTALHWHGLLQSETPWFDGVPSVQQCPIAPGEVLVYKFRADMYGTTWYHSHYSGQYAGGALGPIVIHGPKTEDYDEDLGPVMLSDWYHQDYFTLVNETMNGGVPASDNNLINGKMNYPCENTTFVCTPNAGISKFSFTAGKKYRLRLINTSAEGIQKFTLDGHNFTVIANDFIPINPYSTDVITLGVGQRSDVIVEAVGKAGDAYWMRSNLGTFAKGCSFTSTVSPEALAAVYYEDADTSSVPTTNSTLTDAQLTDCGNDPLSLTTAFCAITPDPVPATSETIDITFASNGTNFVWFMNNSSFRGDYNSPVLSQVKNGNLTFEPEWNVHNFGTNSSIQIVIKNHFQFGAHPMHLHGHNFHVLHEGFGDWDGTVTNPSNTQMRDVQLVRPAQDATTPAYIVLQWTNDNPGVWPLHCHIAWHVSAGLYINVLEDVAGIQARDFPASVADTCASWDAFTSAVVPDQIDSGL